MKTNRNLRVAFSILIVLVLTILACNLPVSIGSKRETAKIVPTNSAVESNLPEAFSTLVGSSPMTITLTEGQLNAIVQQALQSDQIVQGVQIQLQDGQIIITGTVNQQGLSLPLRLTVVVSPDDQGEVNYQIVSASVGPLPLSQGMRDQVEAMINQNLKTQISKLTNSIFIETITIGDGVVNITGHAR